MAESLDLYEIDHIPTRHLGSRAPCFAWLTTSQAHGYVDGIVDCFWDFTDTGGGIVPFISNVSKVEIRCQT